MITDRAETVRSLEEELLRQSSRRSPERLEQLLAPGFVEITASGSLVPREECIRALLAESDDFEFVITDFEVRSVGADSLLATYQLRDTLLGRDRSSWRSSLWVNGAGSWQLAFHQGTPCAPPGGSRP